jgi:hypothetical protein
MAEAVNLAAVASACMLPMAAAAAAEGSLLPPATEGRGSESQFVIHISPFAEAAAMTCAATPGGQLLSARLSDQLPAVFSIEAGVWSIRKGQTATEMAVQLAKAHR